VFGYVLCDKFIVCGICICVCYVYSVGLGVGVLYNTDK